MTWEPPADWPRIETIESHAGGEPLRIVVDGMPDLPGETMLEKRRYAREHHDDLRTALMLEPRGHADMYGAVLTEPVTPDGDAGVLFTHTDGYSTMCGHGVIALGTVLPETGLPGRDREDGDPVLRLDTPAGRVTARPTIEDGRVERVAFENVPAYVVSLAESVHVPDYGRIEYDLAFGGAYYAYCDAAQFDVSVDGDSVADLIDVGRAVKRAVAADVSITHPAADDLGFLYGVVLTDEPRGEGDVRNACIFADGEVDRSPTGTGVSGHLALGHARGTLAPDEPYVVESVIGSTFTGRIRETVDYHGREAVVPEIEGSAHVTGTSTFTVDPADPLGTGFSLR
ncbi:proline racemase family protein [Halopenitus persicus]|uniref:Proline racemase n=1 Tax=Halopenitus persicus TaxID=1048396 RepID=A0A1H3EGC2_9EURY|nr:proline racemase family protein [Halopenitus persicus]SDX77792.1 proline racemase [Halopenitus persicus]